jgi:diphosphoinositol-polyphosphate diphosphatase
LKVDFAVLLRLHNATVEHQSNYLGYGALGERLVAGVVALSADYQHVMLVQSSGKKSWVLPKGGWEDDEATAADAAVREAWEEAGITGRIERDLGEIEDLQGIGGGGKKGERCCRYYCFELVVEKEEQTYPEVSKRARAWCTYEQARKALQSRPELLEALERSAIAR